MAEFDALTKLLVQLRGLSRSFMYELLLLHLTLGTVPVLGRFIFRRSSDIAAFHCWQGPRQGITVWWGTVAACRRD